MTKQEWLKEWNFYPRIEDRRKDGAHLTSVQEELLAEASWQSYRKVRERQKPKPMTPAQRGVKGDLLSSWRTGLQSLRLLREAFPFGKEKTQTAWFREKDLREVLDKDTVVEIVRMSVSHFGREYADTILQELHSFYANQGEEVQVVRAFGPWRSHKLLGIGH